MDKEKRCDECGTLISPKQYEEHGICSLCEMDNDLQMLMDRDRE